MNIVDDMLSPFRVEIKLDLHQICFLCKALNINVAVTNDFTFYTSTQRYPIQYNPTAYSTSVLHPSQMAFLLKPPGDISWQRSFMLVGWWWWWWLCQKELNEETN